jgi:uncharacterized protein (TIGR00255 family)
MVNISVQVAEQKDRFVMVVSMTGFAACKGSGLGYDWAWDLRSVNGKGLDLRLRVPDWVDGLEPLVRAALASAVTRGNVSLTLKLNRDPTAEAATAMRLNLPALTAALQALAKVEHCAMSQGLTLAQPNAADVLALRGIVETGTADEDTAPIRDALMADLPRLLAEFATSRRSEGAALSGVLAAQVGQIVDLTAAAAAEMAAHPDHAATTLKVALARLLDAADGLDETRLAQELALLAVKTDVQEELDRLAAHANAAQDLLAATGPVGRKFDFLTQEFLREANTLCSKSPTLAVTRIGLDLKTVIDQMREQVQNVE